MAQIFGDDRTCAAAGNSDGKIAALRQRRKHKRTIFAVVHGIAENILFAAKGMDPGIQRMVTGRGNRKKCTLQILRHKFPVIAPDGKRTDFAADVRRGHGNVTSERQELFDLAQRHAPPADDRAGFPGNIDKKRKVPHYSASRICSTFCNSSAPSCDFSR